MLSENKRSYLRSSSWRNNRRKGRKRQPRRPSENGAQQLSSETSRGMVLRKQGGLLGLFNKNKKKSIAIPKKMV